MVEPKLKARLWVQACIRRCASESITAVVVRKGDPDAGAILLKLNFLDGRCVVYAQVRDAEGRLAWMKGTGADPVPEADADAYVARQAKYDSDLWVVEIEDRQGRLPVDGPVLG